MDKIKFGPITEKMEEVQITGQACRPKSGCKDDCKRTAWAGASSYRHKSCLIYTFVDAHWTVCF